MVYTVCAVTYVAWVAFLSLNNIDMVNSRYSRAKQRLEPKQIEKIALQELIDQCRQENKRSTKEGELTEDEDPCLSWSPDAVLEQQKVVKIQLLDEKKKSGRKLVLFYVTFIVFFLPLPLVTTYYLLAFIMWMVKGTTWAGRNKKKE